MTRLEKAIKILSVLLIASQFIYLVYIWSDLPSTVPTHFNAAGKVDGWGGKGGLRILPIIGLVLFAGMSVLERFPHIFNYPVLITEENATKLYLEARRMLVILNFEIILIFSLISWMSVQAAFGHEVLGIWVIPIILIVILGTIVISLSRVFRLKKPC
jgi:uncharacterized membrane protein